MDGFIHHSDRLFRWLLWQLWFGCHLAGRVLRAHYKIIIPLFLVFLLGFHFAFYPAIVTKAYLLAVADNWLNLYPPDYVFLYFDSATGIRKGIALRGDDMLHAAAIKSALMQELYEMAGALGQILSFFCLFLIMLLLYGIFFPVLANAWMRQKLIFAPSQLTRITSYLGRDDYKIAGVNLLSTKPSYEVLVTGGEEQIRHQAVAELLAQIRARGEQAIILDNTLAHLPHFYEPQKDVLLNGADIRCANWNLFAEAQNQEEIGAYHRALFDDYRWRSETLASILPVWERDLKLGWLAAQQNRTTSHNILPQFLSDFQDPEAFSQEQKQWSAFVRARYQYLLNMQTSASVFHVQEWLDTRQDSFLFLSHMGDAEQEGRATQILWLDMICQKILQQQNPRPLWLILNEPDMIDSATSHILFHALKRLRSAPQDYPISMLLNIAAPSTTSSAAAHMKGVYFDMAADFTQRLVFGIDDYRQSENPLRLNPYFDWTRKLRVLSVYEAILQTGKAAFLAKVKCPPLSRQTIALGLQTKPDYIIAARTPNVREEKPSPASKQKTGKTKTTHTQSPPARTTRTKTPNTKTPRSETPNLETPRPKIPHAPWKKENE